MATECCNAALQCMHVSISTFTFCAYVTGLRFKAVKVHPDSSRVMLVKLNVHCIVY